MHILYMHRSTPLYISHWSGGYKCIRGLNAVFCLWAGAWQPAVAECDECLCSK